MTAPPRPTAVSRLRARCRQGFVAHSIAVAWIELWGWRAARRAALGVLAVAMGAGAVLGVSGCGPGGPRFPEAGTVEWTLYRHAPLGVTLRVPAAFTPVARGREVAFLHHGIPLRVVWATPEEARDRGLWNAAGPSTPVRLGRAAARRYAYRPCDGPACEAAVAYVVPRCGKAMGVEVRADTGAPPDANPVAADILRSVALDADLSACVR